MVVGAPIPPQAKKYSPPTRGSTRASSENHFTICSGSVMARKTSSGVAFMSMTVSWDLLIFTPDLRIRWRILPAWQRDKRRRAGGNDALLQPARYDISPRGAQ